MKPARFSKRIIGILLVAASMTAWEAVAGKPPDWVHGESSRYPRERYLIGVGSGDVRKAAEDGAYAALSRIFAAEVSQRTREWEKYLQTEAGDKTASQREIEMDQLTAVSTQKILENVSIAESYLDESTKTHYALAVMDRQKAGSTLRERITSLDLEVEELLKTARRAEYKLEKVRALHKGIKTLLLRDAYNTELRVVSNTGKGSESLNRLAGIQQELESFLTQNFRIILQIGGKESDRIRMAVLEGLNRQGLPVSLDTVSNADVVVKGTVEFEPVEMPKGKFIRWTASFELTDPSTGQVIGSVNRQGREGHLTASEAEARALRVVESELSREIGNHLAGYIFGEEPQ